MTSRVIHVRVENFDRQFEDAYMNSESSVAIQVIDKDRVVLGDFHFGPNGAYFNRLVAGEEKKSKRKDWVALSEWLEL